MPDAYRSPLDSRPPLASSSLGGGEPGAGWHAARAV